MAVWLRMLNTLVRALSGLIIALLILVALYILLGRLFLLSAPYFKSDLEAWLSTRLEQPVVIESIQGRWSGFDPVLQVKGVRLGEDAEQSDWALESLIVQPDVLESLVAGELHFHSLKVGALTSLLDIPALIAANRQEQQEKRSNDLSWLSYLDQLSVPGISFEEILIRLPKPHVHDTFWRLSDLKLEKQGSMVRLNGSLKNERGDIELAQLIAEVDLARGVDLIDASAYIRWHNGRLFLPWNSAFESTGFRLDELQARGEVWFIVRNSQLESVISPFEFSGIQGRYQLEDLEPIEQMSGLFYWRQEADGWRAQLDDAVFEWRGQSLLAPRMSLDVTLDEQVLRWDGINVGAMKELLLETGALPEPVTKPLSDYDPAGWLRHGKLTLQDIPGQDRFQLVSALDAFSSQAVTGAPAGEAINGLVLASDKRGEVRFEGPSMSLTFPVLFSEGWTFDQSKGRVLWAIEEEWLRVWADDIQVTNPDGIRAQLAGGFDLLITHSSESANYFSLSLGLQDADARVAARTVPDRMVNASFVEWLERGLQQGEVQEARFRTEGLIGKAAPDEPLSQDLFIRLENAQLTFHSDWPALRDFDGEVSLKDQALSASVFQGYIGDTLLMRPVAISLDRAQEDGTVRIQAQQPFGQADVDYWLKQPVMQSAVGNAFQGWQLQGGTNLDLLVEIPLESGKPSADLLLSLEQASLRVLEPDMTCREMNGQLRYHSKKGAFGRIESTCAGQPADWELNTASWTPGRETLDLHLNSQGNVGELAKRFGFGALPSWIGGSSAFQMSLEIPLNESGGYHLSVSSSLEGLRIEAPAPLGRLTGDSTPLLLQGRWMTKPENSQWELEWAGRASARVRVENGRFSRALVGVGKPVREWPDSPGLWLDGHLRTVDVDEWRDFAERLSPPGTEENRQSQSAHVPELPDWFAGAVFAIDDIRSEQESLLRNVRLGLNPGDEALQAFVESPGRVSGEITLPFQADRLPVVALDYLHLPERQEGDEAQNESELSPSDVPEMQVSVTDFRRGTDQLGTWSTLVRRAGQELRFEEVRGEVPGGLIQGRLRWLEDPVTGQQTTILTGRVKGDRFESFYETWAASSAPLTSNGFKVDTAVVWGGAPMDFAWDQLDGRISFSMEDGGFREVGRSADIFRVFGVLNTDALTRRLQLDFSDIYEKGLAYDLIEGQASIQDGVVDFKTPLAVKAPSSAFKISGTTNLVTDEVNMTMVVVLPVTKNLPLAALLVGAPQIGGALFLIDKLLGDPLSKLTSATYTIKGTLKKPEVKLLQFFENTSQSVGAKP